MEEYAISRLEARLLNDWKMYTDSAYTLIIIHERNQRKGYLHKVRKNSVVQKSNTQCT
jgi:hypothetical protein